MLTIHRHVHVSDFSVMFKHVRDSCSCTFKTVCILTYILVQCPIDFHFKCITHDFCLYKLRGLLKWLCMIVDCIFNMAVCTYNCLIWLSLSKRHQKLCYFKKNISLGYRFRGQKCPSSLSPDTVFLLSIGDSPAAAESPAK